MGNGIVYVQQVQVFEFHDIYQLTGEGGIVRGIFKEGIILCAYFVIKNIGVKGGKAGWPLVGDKMNLMPLLGEA